MLIRALHERAGGSVVPFGRKGDPDFREYHFRPIHEGGPHVCADVDEYDARTLLAIFDAFEEFDPDRPVEQSTPTEKPAAPVEVSPLDSMDRNLLLVFAKVRGKKLDPRHTEEQWRNYLKSIARPRG